MTQGEWEIIETRASFERGAVRARLDLLRPEQGIALAVTGQGATPWAANLLALESPPLNVSRGGRLIDTQLRPFGGGAELAATYSVGDDPALVIDLRWRLTTGTPCGADRTCDAPSASAALAADLIVSVRTRSLDSWPEMHVASRIPAQDAARLVDAQDAFVALPQSADAAFTPRDGAACWRLASRACRYYEMLFPWCFEESWLRADGGDAFVLRHRLFARALEKGVVLRGWIRGMLVLGHEEPTAAIASLYRAFAAERLELGSI